MHSPRNAVVILSLCLLGLFLHASAAQAQRLDSGFDGDGRLSLGFDTVAGSWNDRGVVACGNADRLLVAGFASGGWRIVTARLTDSGALDPSFSDDGKESFNPIRLPLLGEAPPLGACLADGSPILAYTASLGPDESELVVLKLDRLTGLPDQSFGVHGYLHLNFAGSGAVEWPRGLNLIDGELLLGIELLRSDGQFAAVARISAQGALLAHRVLDLPNDPLLGSVTTVARWGEDWLLAGMSSTRNPDFRSLQVARLSSDFASASVDRTYDRPMEAVGRGRLVAPGVIALPALRDAASNAAFPSLVLIRAPNSQSLIEYSTLEFHTPGPQPIAGQPTRAYFYAETPETVPLPDGRVAVVGTLGSRDAGDEGRGLFVAVATIGATSVEDRIDTEFGDRGWWQAEAGPMSCSRPDFAVARTTLWAGRLTFVGHVEAQPCGQNPGDDYWVGRLAPPPLFADGFE